MKKKLGLLVLTLCSAVMIHTTSYAEELHGDLDWKVEFNADKQMVSNFSYENFEDILSYMQPGDSARFQITIQNNYPTELDWYMTNEVLRSLEDTSVVAEGGAYSYILTYTDQEGNIKTLYNSEAVGGENYLENLQGLHEATDALKNYFYLDSLQNGQTGIVKLFVLLDGETQGNDYQDTLAQLKMNFAVELPSEFKDEKTVFRYEGRKRDRHITETGNKIYIDDEETPLIVKTGDETPMVLLFVLAGVLGVVLLVLVIVGSLLRKELKGE